MSLRAPPLSVLPGIAGCLVHGSEVSQPPAFEPHCLQQAPLVMLVVLAEEEAVVVVLSDLSDVGIGEAGARGCGPRDGRDGGRRDHVDDDDDDDDQDDNGTAKGSGTVEDLQLSMLEEGAATESWRSFLLLFLLRPLGAVSFPEEMNDRAGKGGLLHTLRSGDGCLLSRHEKECPVNATVRKENSNMHSSHIDAEQPPRSSITNEPTFGIELPTKAAGLDVSGIKL